MTVQHSPASVPAPSTPGARRALPLVRRTLCAASLALLLAAGPAAAVAGGVEWSRRRTRRPRWRRPA
ncbi:hypothetical protein ACFQVA_08370 [Actinomadura keratinilytica]